MVYCIHTIHQPNHTTNTNTSTLFRLGIGLFRILPYDETFHAYIGSRIGILLSSSTSSYTGSSESSTSETDFFIGIAAGGEYLFSSHFSIGGEVQLNYVSFGEPSITPAPLTSSSQSQSIITNNALMFFRWYF